MQSHRSNAYAMGVLYAKTTSVHDLDNIWDSEELIQEEVFYDITSKKFHEATEVEIDEVLEDFERGFIDSYSD